MQTLLQLGVRGQSQINFVMNLGERNFFDETESVEQFETFHGCSTKWT